MNGSLDKVDQTLQWENLLDNSDDAKLNSETPPELATDLSQDERYFVLLQNAIQKCLSYKPKFGQGREGGLTADEFTTVYGADPFYHWLGLDSPLMYAAHKAAGGMTSVYRQIGIGSQWIFNQILQDQLSLSSKQAQWSYSVKSARGKSRILSLDGRIDLTDIKNSQTRIRLANWMKEVAKEIGLPKTTLAKIKGVVFETRQGYKSKDSKRQNADIANASKAYAHLYVPVILLFSTQIDGDVAQRYKENLWLLLTGTIEGETTDSAYIFCREIIGYDLADFFRRYSPRIKAEIETVLRTLLNP